MEVRIVTSRRGGERERIIRNCVESGYRRGVELTGILLISLEELGDLVTDFAIRDLDVVLGVAVVAHQRKEAIIRDIELVVCTRLAATNR